MAFGVTTFEFQEFQNEPTEEYLLEWATDLFTIATGLTEDPIDDPIGTRLLHRAIYQMAWYLQEDHNNREAMMSGFSSERIGQYSYNKMARTIKDGGDSGVPAFDLALEYFLGKAGKQSISTTSEFVFNQGFQSQNWWN